MKPRTICLVLILALFLGACSRANRIKVSNAWVRPSVPSGMQMEGGSDMSGSEHMVGGNSAAYMLLRNPGDEADKLLSVTTDAAEIAELHITQTENDVTSMRPVDFIEVPPKGETELQPGGYHIMLINLKNKLEAGDKITLNLQFEKAGPVKVKAEVRAP
jgi:hypothetical protein